MTREKRRDESLDRVIQTVVSIMKARGPHDAGVRRIMLDHCRRGNAEAMVQALAEYLIAHGISNGLIPPPTHPIRKELSERACAATIEVLNDYENRGGVLVARRFATKQDLMRVMVRLWAEAKPPPIAGTEDLPDYEKKHERVARAAVSAQALKVLLDTRHLTTKGTYGSAEPAYLIYREELEGFCMKAVRIMEAVYRAPDEWVEKKLTDSEEELSRWVQDLGQEDESCTQD